MISGTVEAIRAFELRDVSVSNNGAAILGGVSFGLDAGGAAAIVGPSGSGKSHALRVINRLTEISGGQIEVLGAPIESWAPGALRRRVGWVPQKPALGEGTVAEIVETPRRLGVIDGDQLAERLGPALEIAGIDDRLARRRCDQLSGGERQRAAIARALICAPEILLLDEPSSSLDGDSATRLLERLLAWARARTCAVAMVTHRLEDVETLAGELVVMEGGAVVAAGRAAEMIAASGQPDRYDVVRLLTGRSRESS